MYTLYLNFIFNHRNSIHNNNQRTSEYDMEFSQAVDYVDHNLKMIREIGNKNKKHKLNNFNKS